MLLLLLRTVGRRPVAAWQQQQQQQQLPSLFRCYRTAAAAQRVVVRTPPLVSFSSSFCSAVTAASYRGGRPKNNAAAATTTTTTTTGGLLFLSSSSGSFRDDDKESDSSGRALVRFRPGDKIMVEVVGFGPLGASVEVIGLGHGDDVPLLPPDEPEAHGYGLVLQKEIAYFRSERNNVDVLRGEILPAFVQRVRPEDGKLDVTLRGYGGKAKSADAGTRIRDKLMETPTGRIDVGEKSSPGEINSVFPGMSKSVFKKALGGLYKKGLVKPGKTQIELME